MAQGEPAEGFMQGPPGDVGGGFRSVRQIADEAAVSGVGIGVHGGEGHHRDLVQRAEYARAQLPAAGVVGVVDRVGVRVQGVGENAQGIADRRHG